MSEITNANKREDHRVTVTKKMVSDALLKLLETKSIDKVTIKEICDLAQINRSTFYNHYGSQYDVLASIEDSMVDDIAQILKKIDPRNAITVREQTKAICTYVKENRSAFLLFTNSSFIIRDFSAKLFSLTNHDSLVGVSSKRNDREGIKSLRLSFYQGGYYYLLYSWLSDHIDASPDELAGLMCEFLPR